jgi:hypothetical protein
MPLEEATYIDGLNAQNPSSTDQIAEGDNHIRLIKAAIRATFPNISAAVTPTAAQLNAITDLAPLASPALTGTPTVPTAAAGTNTTQAASCEFVLQNGVPTGGIMMWSGSVASIPSGWVLCDGANNTPDLRGRFIIGAGDAYAVDATGGSADAVVVSHDHAANSSSISTSSVVDQGHSHKYALGEYATPGNYDYGQNQNHENYDHQGDGPRGYQCDTNVQTTGITVSTNTTTTTDVVPAGESGAGKNLPPYYALAYIMKV